jgi:hypothetical protein
LAAAAADWKSFLSPSLLPLEAASQGKRQRIGLAWLG